jgi:hypothetical protein
MRTKNERKILFGKDKLRRVERKPLFELRGGVACGNKKAREVFILPGFHP